MNTIEKVAELKNLEKDDGIALPLRLDNNGNLWDDQLSLLDTMTPCDINKFLVNLRNAAPKLLDLLDKIQVGDEDRLNTVISIAIMCKSMSDPPTFEESDIECLCRYHDLASQMEAMR